MNRFKNNLLKAYLIALLLFAGAARASGHVDTPADILDFYAFMNPSCTVSGGTGCEAPPEELILALTVNRYATADTRFSETVAYHIYFENDVGVSSQLDCSISADQVVTCTGLNGLSVAAPIGEIGVNGDIRVFAGLRDDPLFIDAAALENFATVGVSAFKAPGTDSFAGSNVLAIVVGIKNNAFPAGSGATDSNGHKINVQKTWVASERTTATINAGVSGSWFNPAQDGQGWVIEWVVGNTFLFYFYGYDDAGEQLWLLGVTKETDDANIAVDVLRFSGEGFGGNFDPDSVMNEIVGTMTFVFSDCRNADVTFESSVSGLDSFSTSMQRITRIASLDCVFSNAGQVDRVGRPGTNNFIPEEKRDAYNADSDPASWVASYTADLEVAMIGIDSADGISGNSFNPPSQLAPILADDRLKVDLEWSACLGIWGFELSELVPQPHTNDCGGRELDYDYLEEFLSMTISGFDPLYDDFVTANDVPFLTEFPFLAAPH